MNQNNSPDISSVVEGVEQSAINRFGELHGTTGKTHTDPEFALKNGFGGTIVQGAFVVAPIMEMGYQIFGESWFAGAQIESKFVSFTRPGDRVFVEFTVIENQVDQCRIDYTCKLQDGKVVQVGSITHPTSGITLS